MGEQEQRERTEGLERGAAYRDDEMELNLRDLWYVLVRRWRLIVAVTFLCGVLGVAFSGYTYVPAYRADATMVINSDTRIIRGEMEETGNDVFLSQEMVNTY